MASSLRIALRRLVRRPLFAVATIGTLAAAITIYTTLFATVDAVVLEPLPYPDPSRLSIVQLRSADAAEGPGTVSYPDLIAWRQGTEGFEALAATPPIPSPSSLGEGAAAEDVAVARVSAGLLRLLGLAPALGRYFVEEDDRPGAAPVAVLSHALWQRRFGAADAVLDQSIRLNERSYRVVGVSPPGLRYPAGTDVWIPLAPSLGHLADNATVRFLEVIGRLRPGRKPETVAVEMGAVFARQPRPDGEPEQRVVLSALHEHLLGEHRETLFALWAAVGLLLLAACANVSHLFLLQSLSRSHEVAMRQALGARRRSLVVEILVESASISFLATGIGLLSAVWLLEILRARAPAGVPRIAEAAVDGRVVLVALALSFVIAILIAALPVMHGSGQQILTRLRDGAGNATASRGTSGLRNALVISELAVSVVLLIGSSLVLRELMSIQRLTNGFRADELTAFRLWLPPARYGEPLDRARLWRGLESEIAAEPGIEAVGMALATPLATNPSRQVRVGRDASSADDGDDRTIGGVDFEAVTPGYAAVLEIDRQRGRFVTAQDRHDGPPVAMLNRSLAERLWPNGDAVGREIRIESFNIQDDRRTVVGVVSDLRHNRGAPVGPAIYVPWDQSPFAHQTYSATFLVRSGQPVDRVVAATHRRLANLDGALGLREVTTLDRLLRGERSRPRFVWRMVGTLTALTLLLTVTGLYSVIGVAVAERRREHALRLALGATPADIALSVVRQALRTAALGIALGFVLVAIGWRLLPRLTVDAGRFEPGVALAVASLMLVLAAVASLVPARRATTADTTAVLRSD